jgi:hypothetical protein
MDTMQNYFVFCAQNINECVHRVCIFTVDIQAEPASLVPGYGTLITKIEGPDKEFVNVDRTPTNTPSVILLLLVT